MAYAALITWNYVLSDETGFLLQRSTNSGSTWTLNLPQPVTTSYVDAAVVTYGTYWYRIAATNQYGTGSFSNTGSVFIPVLPPNPPSNLMLASGSVSASWQSGSVDSNHGPTDYYTFQKSFDGINFSELRVTLIESTIDTNVTASVGTGSTYWYDVAAVNTAGTSSFTPTASISFTYNPIPQAVPRLTASIVP
jgi:titin